MPHHNSVFHSVLKLIPRGAFNALVDKHEANFGARTLTAKTQFCAMLFAQLFGVSSLRELESTLASHKELLYHAGARSVRRSTLADANRDRSAAFFEDLFAAVLARSQQGLPRKMRAAVRLIDSTRIKLSSLSSGWAAFSKGVFASKLHVVYDLDSAQPVYFVVTPSNVNDITPAKALAIEPGATYVFDLGYYDFGWWAQLDAQGCRIVTRLKKNTPLDVVRTLKVPKGSAILSDRIGHLPDRLSHARKNPLADAVREICIRIETGKTLRLFTNDLDATAQEIADLYKSRWEIELFFRWIKQTLKIKHFMGHSQNAVRVQIAVAMIAFLLLRMTQKLYLITGSPLAFARLVRATLTHRRPINREQTACNPPPPSQHQLNLEFATC